MNVIDFDSSLILDMAHSPISNYAIPGITSKLIGMPSKHGTVRLFECSREHMEPIVPHSHRFDFQCVVLSGEVRNLVWEEVSFESDADEYQVSLLSYKGGVGNYELEKQEIGKYSCFEYTYSEGMCYAMKSHEIHSIYFSRGAKVLFFEGPTRSDLSLILQPYVNGEVVPTFKVEPWMFQKESV